jgi:hypothetical protein
MRAAAVVVLASLACACAREPVTFSPLMKSPPDGGYDLLMEGIMSIRSTELAPGAQPARPKISESVATKDAHFIATYDAAVRPDEIGRAMLETFKGAEFLDGAPSIDIGIEDDFVARVEFATAQTEGRIDLTIKSTDSPNRLDIHYLVVENAR